MDGVQSSPESKDRSITNEKVKEESNWAAYSNTISLRLKILIAALF